MEVFVVSTVKAYYDGLIFMPIEPVQVPKGKVVSLSIAYDESTDLKVTEKLAEFRKLTNEIHELNQIEPLTPEFDNIGKLDIVDWTVEQQSNIALGDSR